MACAENLTSLDKLRSMPQVVTSLVIGLRECYAISDLRGVWRG
jgi:hypothetical protein